MDRRTFMVASATAAAGMTFLRGARAEEKPKEKGKEKATAKPSQKYFANAPLKMAASPGWFEGATVFDELEALAAWGLPAYEILGPDPKEVPELRKKADALGLKETCIVGAGAIAPGQMVQPADHDKLEAQFRERVALAKEIGCTRLIGLTGNTRVDATHDQQTGYVIDFLKRIAPIAQENGMTIILEMLNPLVDHKGFFLTRTDQGVTIIKAVGSPNVKLLFDIYHQQITEGNVIRNLTENIKYIGHFHVADNPGRKEPGSGELNYKNIFKAIHGTGYDGYVALECGQTKGCEAALHSVLDCLNWA